MPARRGELNTTSFALLALLAVRPWTTYELARQAERSLGWFWPRATSVLYTEPKKLIAHGLATASRSSTGRRRRTVYTITEAGQKALRAWLDQPGQGASLEFEALVQVAFADRGSHAQLLRTLRSIREESEAHRAAARARIREYVDTGGPFPERMPVIALTGRLLLEHAELVARWAAWAEAEVVQWQGVDLASGARVPPGAFSPVGRLTP
jgi:DNA-binding PadR family transcriptional regulator